MTHGPPPAGPEPTCRECGNPLRENEPQGSLCLRCWNALAAAYRHNVREAKKVLEAGQDILDAEQAAHEAQERKEP